MKVVIGGANGLVGKRLVALLRARGDEVVALVRRRDAGAAWAQGIGQEEWDGKAQGPWAGALDGADAVVNLAGVNVSGKRWSEEYKRAIMDSRLDSTRAIVAAIAAAAQKPRAFVSASAVGYYGARGDEPIDESAAPGHDFLASVCVAWEAEAQKAEAPGVRVVCVRTGVVLAKEGGALPQMMLPFKLFAGGPVGSGKQWFPWIHLDDEAALFAWAIDHDLRGPVNAAAPGIETMGQFSKSLGSALHRPSWAPVPGFALKLLVGEFAGVLTGGQRVVPKKAQEGGFAFKYETSAAALADLLKS